MYSSTPEEFFWNNSDMNFNSFLEDGDADLTDVVLGGSQYSQTHKVCVIKFNFQCADKDLVSAPEVLFHCICGNDEYCEYVNSVTLQVIHTILFHLKTSSEETHFIITSIFDAYH